MGGIIYETKQEIQIALTEPIISDEIELEEYNLFFSEITNKSKEKTTDNLIRTNNLNDEEKPRYQVM